ncbi:MAG: hypothetical protein F6K48_33035, partial [Okeania sp. SIO3H1]|nr:hypothetical protein [Okeania sp. SIO3H1]
QKSFCWGRRQETGDNPPLAPPRRGRQEERGMIEEVGAGVLSLNFSAIIIPKY